MSTAVKKGKPRTPPTAVKVAVAAVIGLGLACASVFFLAGHVAGLANRPGPLGTRAGWFADINLIAEIVLLAGLLAGYGLARGRKFSAHQYNQTGWVLFNIVLVMFIMIVAFGRQVVPGIPAKLLRAYYATAVVHSILGAITVLLAVTLVLRMNKLLPKALRFKGWKNVMRLTLGMYCLVGLFGIATYYIWYVQPREVSGAPEPIVETTGTVVLPVANYAFNPGTLDVPLGTTVVFRNDDPDPHTVTSEIGAFTEGVLQESDTYSVTFDTAGEFPYFCLYHGAAGGVGMAGMVRVGEAAAVAAVPTAVQPPDPTPQPTPAAPPVAALGPQALGFAAFRDGAARNDALDLSASGLPGDAGGEFHAWLTGAGSALHLGVLAAGADGRATLLYVDPAGQNLLAQYTGLAVTLEAAGAAPSTPGGQNVFQDSLPTGAVGPIRELLVASSGAPERRPYALGLVQLSEELFRHAKAVNGAAATGDFDGMNRHIEHMLTIIQGQGGEFYKDFDGDGQLKDPGDGYGLLRYAEGVLAQAGAAQASPGSTQNVRLHAAHLLVLASNMRGWSNTVVDLLIRAHQATAAADQQALAGQALALTRTMLDGVDANGNGVIEPIPGEGGAYTTYFHSQYVAALGALVAPGAPPALETAAAALPTASGVTTSVPTPAVTQVPSPGAAATSAPGGTGAAPAAASATPAPVFITYRNIEIVPAQTTVKVGTPVVFVIQGSLHQPYNLTGANQFEAPPNLGDGANYTFVFNQVGTTTILCGYHASMSATVEVVP